MGSPALIYLAGSYDFTLQGVLVEGRMCLHGTVHRWTHKVLRDIRKAIRDLNSWMSPPPIMLANLPSARPDQERFLRLLGAVPIGSAGTYEGRRLVAWAIPKENP